MRIEDFDFELPPGQIAQSPLERRDTSRLMVLPPGGGEASHHRFSELPSLLRGGDLLVVNDTRVFPARLVGRKAESGGRAELLLVRPVSAAPAGALEGSADGGDWVCLGQASKGFKAGACLEFAHGLKATVLSSEGGGEYRVRLAAPGGERLGELLERAGKLPLPPYIEREPTREDAERYQTVYAKSPGSVAAPTAGLHFTPELLGVLEAKGVEKAAVTLDVGPGTFLPVRDGDVERHRMHPERYCVPAATAEAVRRARAAGRRVVAVGTTVVRTLEAATKEDGELAPGEGETSIFIRPPFAFRQVDALLTNFHLPRSTLLMLVSALSGTARTLSAYRLAVKDGYRFFSYGDAMLVEGGPGARAR
ncbi:MAG: tRNA preQ1(34) S-adenosylmethionine ribosyltransferase-isomerase QueA [Myxococcaceae bacterium]